MQAPKAQGYRAGNRRTTPTRLSRKCFIVNEEGGCLDLNVPEAAIQSHHAADAFKQTCFDEERSGSWGPREY
jgi:hypothetical protein